MRNERFFLDDILRDKKGPPPEDLKIIRGIMFALPVAVVLWLIIGSLAYWIYQTFAG